MPHNDFDKSLRDRLGDYSSPVSADSWKKVRAGWTVYRTVRLSRWLVAAATVAGIVLVILPVHQPVHHPAPTLATRPVLATPAAHPASTTPASPAVIPHSVNHLNIKPTSGSQPNSIATGHVGSDPATADGSKPNPSVPDRPNPSTPGRSNLRPTTPKSAATHHAATHSTTAHPATASGSDAPSATTGPATPSSAAAIAAPGASSSAAPLKSAATPPVRDPQPAPLTTSLATTRFSPGTIAPGAPQKGQLKCPVYPHGPMFAMDHKIHLDVYVSPPWPVGPFNYGWNPTVGARLTVYLTRKFFVTAGLQYAKFNDNLGLDSNRAYVYQYHNIDLPLLIGYSINSGRYTFSPTAGMIFNLYSQYTLANNLRTSGNYHIGPDLWLACDIARHLNDRFSLFAQPYIRYLGSEYPSFESYHSYNVGVLLGLRYDFIRH